MRRVLIVVLALLLVPAVPAQMVTLSAEERAWLDAHGPIRYAPDPGYPPFEQVLDDGTVEGINVDFLNRMSRNLDIEFETVIYSNWTAVLEGMQAGEVDLLGSLAKTDERDVYMDFHGPYMRVGEVFYVRSDSPFTSNEDMADKRIAVIQDYAAADWVAENYPEATLMPVPDMRAGLEAVTTGDADAFFENVPVTGYVIIRESFNNIKILDEPLYYSEANWGVPDGNAVLLSIIDKGMASISHGEQTAIFEYWSGYDLGVRNPPAATPAWIAPLLYGLVGFGLLTLFWVGVLRRTVSRRTEELQQLNEELEHRVAERTADLEQANRHLDSFVGSVSHDLQQPLSAMRLQARVARIKVNKGEVPDFESLERQVKRMSAIIDTLLHFSRVAEINARDDIPLEPIIRDIENLLLAGNTGTREVRVEPGLTAYCDGDLIRIVILNLLGNAWKFTVGRPDALIEIGKDGDRYFIRDNGPGFDAEAMGEEIFKPFVRGHTAGDVGGMGIGLATAARIVRSHGGVISADSRPDHGATFYWTLPRA